MHGWSTWDTQPSAEGWLLFHPDSGLLPPAEVDPVSGYRYYGADQVARPSVLRHLREIAMPLAAVEAVLDAGADETARLLDEHGGEQRRELPARKVCRCPAHARRTKPGLREPATADRPTWLIIAGMRQPVRRHGCQILVLCRSGLPRVTPPSVRIDRCPATPMRCVRDMWVTLGQVIQLTPSTRSRPTGQSLAWANDRFTTLWSNSPPPTLSCRGAPLPHRTLEAEEH
ncbi:MerR family transcriptional regulator [Streptomyces massasporeus]|uniref:MerR family transcriptional regulator n=1 Tax=Streptomyces massasporeus TaxID=67324 RepID=UPI003F4CFF3A